VPPASEKREAVRLSRIETVGAWLHLWTPPRGAEVPPVPWRRVALGALLVLVLVGGIAAYAIPNIDSSKKSAAERERADTARRAEAERRRVIHDQRATLGGAPRPPGDLSDAAQLRSRRDLLRTVEGRITGDARHRASTGELQGRAKRTQCVPAPSSVERRGAEQVLSRGSDAYDCLVVTSDITPTATNKGGALGYPFRAVVHYRTFMFAWCKTNPLPGERAVPNPRRLPLLPKACQAP
jgi:type II secretory pathway pseudopilin PulG